MNQGFEIRVAAIGILRKILLVLQKYVILKFQGGYSTRANARFENKRRMDQKSSGARDFKFKSDECLTSIYLTTIVLPSRL